MDRAEEIARAICSDGELLHALNVLFNRGTGDLERDIEPMVRRIIARHFPQPEPSEVKAETPALKELRERNWRRENMPQPEPEGGAEECAREVILHLWRAGMLVEKRNVTYPVEGAANRIAPVVRLFLAAARAAGAREAERLLRLSCAEICGDDTGDKSLEFLRQKQSPELADLSLAIQTGYHAAQKRAEALEGLLRQIRRTYLALESCECDDRLMGQCLSCRIDAALEESPDGR